MISLIRTIQLVCATSALLSQSVNDLNSLVLQAKRYAMHETAGQSSQPVLSLYRIIGDHGDAAQSPMARSLDLQQWTLVYLIESPGGPLPPRAGGNPQSLYVQCQSGLFKDIMWSPLPVFDCKSLEWAWITLTLDQAVAQLGLLGYTGGFTTLTLERPLHPRLSDECTFVFKCAGDHVYVGISAQTGALLWTQPF